LDVEINLLQEFFFAQCRS